MYCIFPTCGLAALKAGGRIESYLPMSLACLLPLFHFGGFFGQIFVALVSFLNLFFKTPFARVCEMVGFFQ